MPDRAGRLDKFNFTGLLIDLWWWKSVQEESLTRRTRTSGFQTERWRCCRRQGFPPLWLLWCPRTLDLGSETDLWLRESTKQRRCREERLIDDVWWRESKLKGEGKEQRERAKQRWVFSKIKKDETFTYYQRSRANCTYSYCRVDGSGVQHWWEKRG